VKIYNKLVRDRIPEIVAASGKQARFRTLEPDEYMIHLQQKLAEEMAEYQADKSLEELADLVEVAQAIAAAQGLTWEQFEALRRKKREERGGFALRLLLESVE
jgi:predicted house-cleaning noncanonical NTP pyrophosphatase (MazG superfamily)